MIVDINIIKYEIAVAKLQSRKVDLTDGVLTIEIYRKPGRVSRMRATIADYEDFDALLDAVRAWLTGA